MKVGVLGFAHGHVSAYCRRWLDNESLGIDLVDFLQNVQQVAQAPGTAGHRAPFVSSWLRPILREQGVHSILKSIVEIGVEVAATGRRQAVTSFHEHRGWPTPY